MSHTRPFVFTGIGILLIVIGLTLASITPTHAQTPTTPPDNEGCVGCHENLYYLHDTGKWYCQCASSPDCTSCHGGNPTVLTEKEAHLGMIASPTKNDAEICQGCHPTDYHTRIEQFAVIAGIKPTHPPCPTPTSTVNGAVTTGGSPPPSLIAPKPANFWQISGIVLAGLAGLVFFIFFCRCWRQDQAIIS